MNISKFENQERWVRNLITVSYQLITINLAVSIVFWAFFVLEMNEVNQLLYWMLYIITPTMILLLMAFIGDMLIRSKKLKLITKEYISIILIILMMGFLSAVHNIILVFLLSFTIPIFVSTIFSNARLTRLSYITSQLLMILIAFIMINYSTRDYGLWIYAEVLVASGSLLVSYLMSKVIMDYTQNQIANLDIMYKDKMELEHKMKIDPLTGLFNRNVYDSHFSKCMEKSIKDNTDLSLAVLDIDNFKLINDTYGHAVGDIILTEFAKVLLMAQSEDIHAFRIGGEEFAIIFTNHDKDYALMATSEILDKIRDMTFVDANNKGITVSAGVASRNQELVDAKKLFIAADKALYNAKGKGKNRVSPCK